MTKLHFNTHLSWRGEIHLQNLRLEDAKELFHLIEKNRSHLRAFLHWLDHQKREQDTIAFIAKERALADRNESLTLSIRYRKKLVGVVGLHHIDVWNHCASIGYWLDKGHEGKGIMTRSIKALIDHARYVLKLHRIQIVCAVENQKSQKIAACLGFYKEGTLKDAIWHYDHYFDAYLYGLILQETEISQST